MIEKWTVLGFRIYVCSPNAVSPFLVLASMSAPFFTKISKISGWKAEQKPFYLSENKEDIMLTIMIDKINR